MSETVLVTGGAGFIGSALVRRLVGTTALRVVNIDKLTYAGNTESLAPVEQSERYVFEQADIADATSIRRILHEYQPRALIHLAAESHVDRSIDGPAPFIGTNVVGTFVLLAEALAYYEETKKRRNEETKKRKNEETKERGNEGTKKRRNEGTSGFRFVHVSTDEVFGSLGDSGRFTSDTPYDPSSPYSASKASSDHLVRAWHRTYGLPAVITNCSNNYGPYQFPEKLVPLTIIKALAGEQLPVYGKGENVRDWLYVDDHAAALQLVMERGVPGETYLIGGNSERRNIDVVRAICALLDELQPRAGLYEELITFVKDRPGHDYRYAIDASLIREQLGWSPAETFVSGLRKTVIWYLENEGWWRRVLSGEYRLERLGVRV